LLFPLTLPSPKGERVKEGRLKIKVLFQSSYALKED